MAWYSCYWDDEGGGSLYTERAGHAAQKMDPQLRKLLEVSYEALLHAGIIIGELPPERCGVYIGCCGSEVHAMGYLPLLDLWSCIGALCLWYVGDVNLSTNSCQRVCNTTCLRPKLAYALVQALGGGDAVLCLISPQSPQLLCVKQVPQV